MSRVAFHGGVAYIVSDGMGGENAGGRAAELTVQTLERLLAALVDPEQARSELRSALQEANKLVYEAGHAGDARTRGMGATAVVCLVRDASILIGNVGDSRAYLHRGRTLSRLTRSHTRAQQLVDEGILSAEQAECHPDAAVLVRAIGYRPDVDADIGEWMRMREGDEVLLCTDGLFGGARDEEIEAALARRGSAEELADGLVALALQKGGRDNVTVQLLRLGAQGWRIDWRKAGGEAARLGAVVAACVGGSYLAAIAGVRGEQPRLESIEAQLQTLRNDDRQRQEELARTLDEITARVAVLESRLDRMNGARKGNSKRAAPDPPVPRAGKMSLRGANAWGDRLHGDPTRVARFGWQDGI